MTRTMTRGELFDAAFPPDPSTGRRPAMDFAIPQGVFNQMTDVARQCYVGWIYDGDAHIFGRLLTVQECNDRIAKLNPRCPACGSPATPRHNCDHDGEAR